MGKIDYKKAHERICIAFCKGMLTRYGVRQMVETEVEVEQRGRVYWEKGPIFKDDKGRKLRKIGKLKREPSTKVKHVVEVPHGVVPDEMLKMAEGMAAAFVEVLKIAEESGIIVEESVVGAGVDNLLGDES